MRMLTSKEGYIVNDIQNQRGFPLIFRKGSNAPNGLHDTSSGCQKNQGINVSKIETDRSNIISGDNESMGLIVDDLAFLGFQGTGKINHFLLWMTSLAITNQLFPKFHSLNQTQSSTTVSDAPG